MLDRWMRVHPRNARTMHSLHVHTQSSNWRATRRFNHRATYYVLRIRAAAWGQPMAAKIRWMIKDCSESASIPCKSGLDPGTSGCRDQRIAWHDTRSKTSQWCCCTCVRFARSSKGLAREPRWIRSFSRPSPKQSRRGCTRMMGRMVDRCNARRMGQLVWSRQGGRTSV